MIRQLEWFKWKHFDSFDVDNHSFEQMRFFIFSCHIVIFDEREKEDLIMNEF